MLLLLRPLVPHELDGSNLPLTGRKLERVLRPGTAGWRPEDPASTLKVTAVIIV
jgi:hypothetical protein